MTTNYIRYIDDSSMKSLCDELEKNNRIATGDFSKYGVKKGLRNSDGTGVMAGLTQICSVEGYYINDGERVPKEGRLIYRGYDMATLVKNCQKENRFGFEEIAWLLIFGSLPTKEQLEMFRATLAMCRELPDDFIEDMIMKAPSPDIMNKMARSVLALYSYDSNPDDTSVENMLRQCIHLVAQLPSIMTYAYQVKRRTYYKKSMYIHQPKAEHSTAETILRFTRADRTFTDEEAKLLDLLLCIHAEHGGGNNSTFTTRVLSSSGTDTYSAIGAAIGSLKGPRHGGANIKAHQMIAEIYENVKNHESDGEIADYLKKIINKEAGDRSGLIYGMGHAIYTLSDPRAVLLKEKAGEFVKGTEYEERFNMISRIEALSPQVFADVKGVKKPLCANVDMYSGLIYEMLKIPVDLFTPMFAVARVAGWSAHRIEEMTTAKKIIRPAYKSVAHAREYVSLDERTVSEGTSSGIYIPREQR